MNTCNWNCNETGGCSKCSTFTYLTDTNGGKITLFQILWDCDVQIQEKQKHIEELEATIKQIKKYVRHKEDCEVSLVHYAYDAVCDCGYVEALEQE